MDMCLLLAVMNCQNVMANSRGCRWQSNLPDVDVQHAINFVCVCVFRFVKVQRVRPIYFSPADKWLLRDMLSMAARL